MELNEFLEEVDHFMDDDLERLIDASAARPKDVEVLNLVMDGLSTWQVSLQTMVAVG